MDTQLEKRLQEAQNKVAAIEAKQADIAAQLGAAKQAIERAESEYQAQLAASVLDGNADTARARKALDAAREHVDKLTAALARLGRDMAHALQEVSEAERAILVRQIADLDTEGEALYRATVRALSDIWRAGQCAVDTAHLAPYDRAKSEGLSEGKAHIWRAMLSMSCGVADLLTILEQAAPAVFAEVGGVSKRERDYWVQGVYRRKAP